MTLEEVIQLTKQALEKVNPDKRVYSEFRFTVEQVKQLLEWLEEYHKIKEYWLPSGEEELRKERGECNNLYDKIDIVVSGLYSAIADKIIEKIGLENKYKQLEADYIELGNRLRMANTEIDRLRSESSWIPCEERMPEEWKDVIVCFSDSDDVMIANHLDYWQESRECIPLNNVTHWMPLPYKPDKEVTE